MLKFYKKLQVTYGVYGMSCKHEEDFYKWAINTAQILRGREIEEIDADRVAGYIEDLGKKEKEEVITCLSSIISHVLQWHFHRGWNQDGWVPIIRGWRENIEKSLRQSPSLKDFLEEMLKDAYKLGVSHAVRMNGEKFFPPKCPYTFEQLMYGDFYKEPHLGIVKTHNFLRIPVQFRSKS